MKTTAALLLVMLLLAGGVRAETTTFVWELGARIARLDGKDSGVGPAGTFGLLWPLRSNVETGVELTLSRFDRSPKPGVLRWGSAEPEALRPTLVTLTNAYRFSSAPSAGLHPFGLCAAGIGVFRSGRWESSGSPEASVHEPSADHWGPCVEFGFGLQRNPARPIIGFEASARVQGLLLDRATYGAALQVSLLY